MRRRYNITIDDVVYRRVKAEAAGAGLTVGAWMESKLSTFSKDLVKEAQEKS